jgi:deoxyribodipyrimidine photo-lyase
MTGVMHTMESFPSSRQAALQRLAEFVAGGTADYARTRNFVRSGHGNVSRLSAAVRHRLISEEEVLTAVLAAHRFSAVEKFVQEVVWRTYWKGWLEHHPGVWADYVRQAAAGPATAAELAAAAPTGGAIQRCTGELRATGYLHNHARMWWAAWWCHQQGLPWAAGARFFFDHLLDADAASNTLGWRWVAGLQTPGKAYLARRDNVAKYWEEHGSLDALDDSAGARIPAETANRSRVDVPEYAEAPPPLDRPVLLLGHADDLSIETTPLGGLRPATIALIDQAGENDGEAKQAWRRRAIDDAANRWSQHYGQPVERLSRWDAVSTWAVRAGGGHLVMMAPFVGPDADAWSPQHRALQEAGIEVTACRRAWDQRLFPAARAGFFPFWHKVRPLLSKRLLSAQAPPLTPRHESATDVFPSDREGYDKT